MGNKLRKNKLAEPVHNDNHTIKKTLPKAQLNPPKPTKSSMLQPTSSSTFSPINYSEFIVNGYIRGIGLLHTQIVPKEIICFCLRYYIQLNDQHLIYLPNHPKSAYNLHLCGLNGHQMVSNYSLHLIFHTKMNNNSVILSSPYKQWKHHFNQSTTCFVNNISFPINMYPNISEYIGSKCIFEINSNSLHRSIYCNVIIWSDNTNKKNDALMIRLPAPGVYEIGSTLSYSYKNGLLYVVRDYLYYLSFTKKHNFRAIDWFKYDDYGLNSRRKYATSVIVEDDDKQEMFFIIGGNQMNGVTMEYRYIKSYSFWRSLSMNNAYSRTHCGSCYDKISKRIYLGGGEGGGLYKDNKQMEYYDINKQKWINLPKTNLKHPNYPSLWVDKYNHNILYIVCSNSKYIEGIDLRCSNNKWFATSITKYFNVDIDKSGQILT